VLGKVVPFGFGAVIGGGANFLVARTIIGASRRAFGKPAPAFDSKSDVFEEEPFEPADDSPLEPAPE
jgi:hypothetical protein